MTQVLDKWLLATEPGLRGPLPSDVRKGRSKLHIGTIFLVRIVVSYVRFGTSLSHIKQHSKRVEGGLQEQPLSGDTAMCRRCKRDVPNCT